MEHVTPLQHSLLKRSAEKKSPLHGGEEFNQRCPGQTPSQVFP